MPWSSACVEGKICVCSNRYYINTCISRVKKEMTYLQKSLQGTKYIALIKAPCDPDLIPSLKDIKKIACNTKITEKLALHSEASTSGYKI